jgi:hypothetical protein
MTYSILSKEILLFHWKNRGRLIFGLIQYSLLISILLIHYFVNVKHVDLYETIRFTISILARMRRLYETGIGLTTGFIGSHTVTHNYSVYTLTAHYSSL